MAPKGTGNKAWDKIRKRAREQGHQRIQDMAAAMPTSGYLKIAQKNQKLDDAAWQIELEKKEAEKAEEKAIKAEERKANARARYRAKKLEEENDPQLAAEAKEKRKAAAAKRKAAKDAAKVTEGAKENERGEKGAEVPDGDVSDDESDPVPIKTKPNLKKRAHQATVEDEDSASESESEKISKKKMKRASGNKDSADIDLNDPLLNNCGGEQQWPLYPGRSQRKVSTTIGIAQIPFAMKDEFVKDLMEAMGNFANRGAKIVINKEGGICVRFAKADIAEMVKDEIDGKEVGGKRVQITYVA